MATTKVLLALAGAGTLVTALLLGSVIPVRADSDHVAARRLLDAGEIMPLEKIAERARAEKPGQILETELKHKHDKYIYEVEILDGGGRVWELRLDARSGELLKVEKDD
ncbi:MAG: PepSY domain-containing protein [Sterolibacteriaceae bacterium]|jgi:uncharacterized membrane protein YkoI|nr:PepSY domain-containing protein [Sterolibacteriaceae bacterium]MBK9084748.1 PepSY domain-containing protein [Sterolibacteriaceae bacterium]